MYHLPQEIEVWYIIPAVRKELAKLLTKEYGRNYEEAGKILGVSKAAISQYLNKKRASKVKFNMEVKKEVKKSAEKINKNEDLAVSEILRILKIIKKSGCECEVCRKYNKGILNKCKERPG